MPVLVYIYKNLRSIVFAFGLVSFFAPSSSSSSFCFASSSSSPSCYVMFFWLFSLLYLTVFKHFFYLHIQVWLKSNINKCVVETTNDVSFMRIWYADFPMPGVFRTVVSFGWASFFVFLPHISITMDGACRKKRSCERLQSAISIGIFYFICYLYGNGFCVRLSYVLHVKVEAEKSAHNVCLSFSDFFPTCVHAFSWLTTSGLF